MSWFRLSRAQCVFVLLFFCFHVSLVVLSGFKLSGFCDWHTENFSKQYYNEREEIERKKLAKIMNEDRLDDKAQESCVFLTPSLVGTKTSNKLYSIPRIILDPTIKLKTVF